MDSSRKFKDLPDILTVLEMCSVIGIGQATGYNLLKEGKIAHFKLGKAYRIPKSSLLTYLSKIAGEVIS